MASADATSTSATQHITFLFWRTPWAPTVHRCSLTISAGPRFFFAQVGIPTKDFAENLRCLQRVLPQFLPAELAAIGCTFVAAGLAATAATPRRAADPYGGIHPFGTAGKRDLEALLAQTDRMPAS